MITVKGRIVDMNPNEILVEYRTFNGRRRRIRIQAKRSRSLQDAFLFEDEVTIEMEG